MSQAPWTLSSPSSLDSDHIPRSPASPVTPPPAASRDSDSMSQAPATAVPAYSFPSVQARRTFVETHAGFIVKMMESINVELFDHKDPLVQMASAYIDGIQEDNASHYLHAPDLQNPETLSDDYFMIWAHTAWGEKEIMPWKAFRQMVYDNFEVPRFLRELLTRGTPLYSEWTTGRGLRLTADQNVAVALLRSEALMVPISEASWDDPKPVNSVLYSQEEDFDQDFPTAGYFNGRAYFTLPPGQENKIFKPWYHFGQIGYHDIPDWPASSNMPSRLVTDLPAEIMLMILEKLFKIDGDIHIIFDEFENEHVAVVERERRLQKHPFGVQGEKLPYGNFWKLPTIRHFFAFGITGRDNWVMMREMFYKKNTFIIHDD